MWRENWQTRLLILLGNLCSSDGCISENATNKHLGNGDCFQLLPLAIWSICYGVFMLLFEIFLLSLGKLRQNNVLKHVHVQRWKRTCGACVVQTYLVLLIQYTKLYLFFLSSPPSYCKLPILIYDHFQDVFWIHLHLAASFKKIGIKFSSWLHPTVHVLLMKPVKVCRSSSQIFHF